MNYKKLLNEFKTLGCPDDLICTTASKVYIDMCIVRKLWNVEYKYDTEFNIIYLHGQKSENDVIEIYIPILSHNNINFELYTKIGNKLVKEIETKDNSIILVIIDSNSSCLYYRISDGIPDLSSDTEEEIEDMKTEGMSTEPIVDNVKNNENKKRIVNLETDERSPKKPKESN